MARIDKIAFSFRAPAGTAFAAGVYGVRVDSGGSLVPSGTAAGEGAQGVLCLAGAAVAGDPLSALRNAEIVEFGGSAGSAYYAGAAGTVSLTSTNATLVGFTVEGNRLVVAL